MEPVDRKAVVRDLMSTHPLFRKKFLNRMDFPFTGLSKSQHGVLMALHLRGTMNMGQLAAEIDISVQQISKTVNSLEDMGYVRRYIDRANRRQIWVSLTEDCVEQFKKAFDAHDSLLVKSFSSLSDEDMASLQRAARTILEILNKMQDRPLREQTLKDEEK